MLVLSAAVLVIVIEHRLQARAALHVDAIHAANRYAYRFGGWMWIEYDYRSPEHRYAEQEPFISRFLVLAPINPEEPALGGLRG